MTTRPATPSQTVGPFFLHGLEWLATGTLGSDPDQTLTGRLIDGAGDPVNDALVELWHPSVGWGRAIVDRDGFFRFQISTRELSAEAGEGAGATHVRIAVFARGLLRPVLSRIYFPDDPAVDDDPVLRTVDPPRRSTLIATPDDGGYRFDVVLQGEHETVFFDGW